MKIINFTAKCILPKLLNKEKCQTIRSAFKLTDNKIILKPSRFKVHDKVKLMWKQRSPYNEFCTVCGNSIKKPPGRAIYCDTENCPEFGRTTNTFNKILGTGTITEVFKIRMKKDIILNSSRYQIESPFMESDTNISKKDGFSSIINMYVWFDKKYDISDIKPFWVYRWKWD